MTSKDKIVKFLENKDSYIYNLSNLRFSDKEDVDEIKSWTIKKCNHVWQTLNNNVNQIEFKELTDDCICPWCILISNMKLNSCSKCQYGKRHTICSKLTSRYFKLIKAEMLTDQHRRNYIKMIKEIEGS